MPRGSKRKRMSLLGRRAAPAKRRITARTQGASLVTRMKRLVQGATKTTPQVTRITGTVANNLSMCLTSSQPLDTAGNATGQIIGDGDSANLNFLEVRGYLSLRRSVITQGDGIVRARIMIVKYADPRGIYAPQAGGSNVPVAPSCLEFALIDEHFVDPNRNTGKYHILYDKTISLGRNSENAIAQPGLVTEVGSNYFPLNFKKKLNFNQKYREHCTPGNPGGHYDNNLAEGQIASNGLYMYILTDLAANAGSIYGRLKTRLNYTMT